jgi:hypothetical protein
MYKDPIGSICREIASNCRDANREIGNSDAEINIRIVKANKWSYTESGYIEFEDFGPGISPDRMENVFCKYAASTKRTTDIFTGGFGLGAKTPFSYSDTFNIHTYVDGIEYIYISSIDETNCGKVILVSKEATERPNGTIIKIPIKTQEDVDSFLKESIKQTLFWEEKVNIYLNGVIQDRKIKDDSLRTQNSHFAIFNNFQLYNRGYNGVAISIDGVYYPLEYINGIKCPNLSNNLLLIKFENGELAIAGNRENLQYDTKTVDKINSKIESALSFIESEMQKEIESLPSFLHACNYINYYKKDNPYKYQGFARHFTFNYNGNPRCTWKTHEILDGVRLDTAKIVQYLPKSYSKGRELTHFKKLDNVIISDLVDKDAFFIHPHQNDFLKRIRTYIEKENKPLTCVFFEPIPILSDLLKKYDYVKNASELKKIKETSEKTIEEYKERRKKEETLLNLLFPDGKDITSLDATKTSIIKNKEEEAPKSVPLMFRSPKTYIKKMCYSTEEDAFFASHTYNPNFIKKICIIKKVKVLKDITEEDLRDLSAWGNILDTDVIFVRDDLGIIPESHLLETYIEKRRREIEDLFCKKIIMEDINKDFVSVFLDYKIKCNYDEYFKDFPKECSFLKEIKSSFVEKFLLAKKINDCKKINQEILEACRALPLLFAIRHVNPTKDHIIEYIKAFSPNLL